MTRLPRSNCDVSELRCAARPRSRHSRWTAVTGETHLMKQISRPTYLTLLTYLVLLLGFFLLCWRLSLNHSLWLDEASLALELLSRDFLKLSQPLDGQAAPILFLWFMKIATLMGNTGELALRFIPFISGVGALIGFYFCSREILSKEGALIAVVLFALSPALIDYSAEAKQYSTDIFVSVIVTYTGFRMIKARSWDIVLISTFLLATLIWLSHPTPFLLSAIGGVGLCQALLKKDRTQGRYFFIAITVWLASFISFYVLSLKGLNDRQDLVNYWRGVHDAFMPLGGESLSWLFAKTSELLAVPRLGPPLFMLILALLGSVILLRRDWRHAVIVIMPIFVTIAVSGAKLYPFAQRLILFLLPQLVLLVATALESLLAIKWRYVGWAALLLAISALLINPLRWNAALIVAPQNFAKENFRQVLANVVSSAECKRNIFIRNGAEKLYEYYDLYGGFDLKYEAKIVTGVGIRKARDEHLPCLWIVYAHVSKADQDSDAVVFSSSHYQAARIINEIGASATLYVSKCGGHC